MVGDLKGWNPDPFGIHEFRFFSDDGKPTLLVRDGNQRSYDQPPTSDDALYAKPFVPTVEGEPQAGIVWQVSDHPVESNGHAAVHPVNRRPLGSPTSLEPAESAEHAAPLTSTPAKAAYIIVLAIMAVSALALVVVHLVGHRTPTRSATTSTTTSAPKATTSTNAPTTLPPPAALQPSAAIAAADLISSWADGNQAAALSVATAPAVATLFAGHYTRGLVIDRGCSTTFVPIICSYGPPGGAAPTDPIYQISVSQATGGWYVSSVKINN
jgi:hypothetical protein